MMAGTRYNSRAGSSGAASYKLRSTCTHTSSPTMSINRKLALLGRPISGPVRRAHQFLHSTYDAQGFAQNAGVGHGWIEGGPLLPVKNEYYQAGLAVEALRALSNLGRLVGKNDVSKQLAAEFEHSEPALDRAFWSPEMRSYAFALKPDN